MRRFFVVMLAAGTAAGALIVTTARPEAQGQGLALGRPEVTRAVAHAVSRPLRDIPSRPMISTRPDFEVLRPAGPERGAPDTAVQSVAAATFAGSTGTSFEGIGDGAYGFDVRYAPPDTVGEAGDTQYVQWVNVSLAVFNKSDGTLADGPKAGNTIWTDLGGDCATRNDGDPIVQWDQFAHRWILTQFSLRSGNYLQCVAVSQTSDATGRYYLYAFPQPDFPDYPKVGVWPDAYYITYNMFRNGTSFRGARACAMDRTAMINGDPQAAQQCFQTSTSYHSLLPADLEGQTLPPAGAPNYLLSRYGSSTITLWKFHVDWSSPANSTFIGPTAIPVAGYSLACGGGSCIPQAGTTNQLDSLGDRLMYRLSYRNLGTSASPDEHLVVNHSVNAGSSTGIRWYDIKVSAGSPSVYQSGTYAPDGMYRWMGSIAMDHVGNIAVGYSVSSASTNPAIKFAAREATSPLGELTAEFGLTDGKGSQTGTLHRWGDYSTLSVDPTDDCTFWYTTEYLNTNGSFNWNTRVHSFKFASCATTPPPPVASVSLSMSPTSQSVDPGTTADYTVTLSKSNYNGSGTYAVSGLPAGSYAFPATYAGGTNDDTQTLSVNTGALSGTYAFTITATDGADALITDSVSGTLTVSPPVTADFSISASPGSRNVRAGQDTTYTVTVSGTGGFTGTVTFGVDGLPTGASFSVADVTGAGSTTLGISTGSAAKGTYPLTITGTSGALTRSTTVSLRIR